MTLADEVRAREERRSWSNTDALLARLINLTSVLRIDFLASKGVKQHNLPKPIVIYRPGDEPKKPGMTMREFARFLKGAR